ncbi:MAG TPA: FtsH protease activity modulator HflK [Azospirillaceae bacterium]|nr:FtsH protease activity modulator HflK [Azospirillaceae bacterium]
MPWNNQGGGGSGGPWGPPPGGGGRNPWGQGGGGGGFGGGQQSPDLEDLLRKSQDRLRRLFPGGGNGGKGLLAVLGVLMLVWLFTGVYRVQPDEQGVVLRFGQYVRTEQPGLRYHLPTPIETVELPKVTLVNRVEVGFRSAGESRRPGGERDIPDESLMLTGDENIIDIDFNVFWVIKDAGNYLFRIRNPQDTVRRAAESAMREIIGRTEIQPALTDAREEIEVQTRRLLQQMLDDYQSGVEVTQVQLLKVDPPGPVVDAFNDVQRARSDRERLRNEAEAYRNDIIPRARGDAERLLQEAAAYREQVISLAQGDARRFASVLDAYKQAPEVTAQRIYLETMEQVLRGTNKVIIDAAGENGQGVVPYLPLPDIMRQMPRPGTPQAQPQQAPRR